MKRVLLIVGAMLCCGCMPSYPNASGLPQGIIPAEEFSRAVKDGKGSQFSILHVEKLRDEESAAEVTSAAA